MRYGDGDAALLVDAAADRQRLPFPIAASLPARPAPAMMVRMRFARGIETQSRRGVLERNMRSGEL